MSTLQENLSQLREQALMQESPEVWKEIEETCRSLANTLRSKDPNQDNHTALGSTSLPQQLKDILSLALHGHSTPSEELSAVVFEILRVSANLCMDHDANRGHLLEANFPQTVVAMLEGYVETLSDGGNTPLSVPHLRVARTAMGVLLNLSIGYEPVKSRLKSLEVPITILKLSAATYIPGDWLHQLDSLQDDPAEEVWNLRIALANWTWRVISELQDDDSLPIFDTSVLPLLTPPLRTFIPTDEDNILLPNYPIINSLIHADFESLEESCTLIESLSLDVQDVRLSLARGLNTPAEHNGIPCLSTIINFIEKGNYSKLWSRLGTDEQRKQKAFDMCKAACIKSVVEVAGEDGNEEVIWDESNEVCPGGDFVHRMAGWIKEYANDTTEGMRDDLVICAALSLSNLTRREAQARILLSPPHSLASILTSPRCLSPSIDIKIMHGVLGLLRHVAQSSPKQGIVHEELIKAQVVHRVAESGVWDEKINTMGEVVQVSAIGVLKACCIANVENTFSAVLPSEASSTRPTALMQILALVQRTESIIVKSEGTRAIINMVKSLWAASSGRTSATTSPVASVDTNEGSLDKAKKRQECIRLIASYETALAIAALIERSSRHPVLINEGVVALTLLASHPPSSRVVLEAILAPTGAPTPQQPDGSPDGTLIGDAVVNKTPRRALDLLVLVLEGDEQISSPIEVRINVCSLLAQVSKNNVSASELASVKDTTRTTLEALVEKYQENKGKDGILAAAANKALGIWG